MSVIQFIPAPLKPDTRTLGRQARWVPHVGFARSCPVCRHSSRRFARFGRQPREDARWMYCDSLERHRFLCLFLERRSELLRGGMARLLRRMAGPGCLSADPFDPSVRERMDSCDIRHPDASFDAIYYSHVLEHLAAGRKTLRSFHRILRDDGWAPLMLTYPGPALEDPSIVTVQARLGAFGQEDHVRRYGDDLVDRLTAAGFEVATFSARDFAAPVEVERMDLTAAVGDIYFCTKRRPEGALP